MSGSDTSVAIPRTGIILKMKTRPTAEEIVERGERIYHDRLQPSVETEENVGHYIAIDVETGAYVIGGSYSDVGSRLETSRELLAKNPSALIYLGLIGYPASGAIGGSLRPNSPSTHRK